MPPRLYLLALATFAANLGLSIIFPLIPHLAKSGPHAVGWIFSSYAAALVLAQVLGGVLADRLDARKLLAVALWGYCATLVGFTLSASIPYLMVVRGLEGAAIGLVIPAVMKLGVAAVPPERRGRAIGLVMGLGGIGFIIGPLLGGTLAAWGLALPFYVAAAVAAVAALGVTVGLGGAASPALSEPLGLVVRHEFGRMGHMLATPAFFGLVLPLMAFKVNFSTMQAGLPMYGADRLGASLTTIGALFVVTAVAYGLVQPLAGRLSDRFSTHALIALTLGTLICLLAVLPLPTGLWGFVPLWALFSVFQSAGVLFAMKHLGDAMAEGGSGRTFGLAAAIGDTGMILAPSLLMPLYAWHPAGFFWGLAAVMGTALAGHTLLTARASRAAGTLPAARGREGWGPNGPPIEP